MLAVIATTTFQNEICGGIKSVTFPQDGQTCLYPFPCGMWICVGGSCDLSLHLVSCGKSKKPPCFLGLVVLPSFLNKSSIFFEICPYQTATTANKVFMQAGGNLRII